MPSSGNRFLIVAFDVLRPDMVTPEMMPNLCTFAGAGVRFSHSRATFPTETRVNQAVLVTGCTPARHGIVGNKFMDPAAEVAPIGRASLVLAPIWVWLGVGEVPSTLTLAGGAVVFLAITGHGVLAIRRSRVALESDA